MKKIMFTVVFLISFAVNAQQAMVDVTLNPAGSFKGKTADVKGFATKKGDEVFAKDIIVDLKNLKTGVDLRDKHTKKHLEVDKYPQAILLSATGKGGKGSGIIKIHGVEKNIVGTYKIVGNILNAQFQVLLSDFGITGIKYMGIGVDDEVKIHISIPIK